MFGCFQFGEFLIGASPVEGGCGGLELGREVVQLNSLSCLAAALTSEWREVLVLKSNIVVQEIDSSLPLESTIYEDVFL